VEWLFCILPCGPVSMRSLVLRIPTGLRPLNICIDASPYVVRVYVEAPARVVSPLTVTTYDDFCDSKYCAKYSRANNVPNKNNIFGEFFINLVELLLLFSVVVDIIHTYETRNPNKAKQ
jgi:hypothetical protein